jgi:hypothetical protein
MADIVDFARQREEMQSVERVMQPVMLGMDNAATAWLAAGSDPRAISDAGGSSVRLLGGGQARG